jgi:phage gp29-like protein
MIARPDLKIFNDIPVTVLTDWDRPSAKSAIDQHDLGYFAGTAQLSEAMLRDDRISSVLETRLLGLLGCDLKVEEPKGLEEDEDAKAAAEEVEARWEEMFPDDVLKGLLRWCVMMRFCLAELLWEGDENGWTFKLRLWHPMFVWYDVWRRQYVVNTQDGPVWITPGDGKWFLWCPDGEYRGWIQAAVRSLADPWLARTFNFRDWQRYNEMHGLPIRKISCPSQAPEPEKDQFFAQVSMLGTDNTLLCPQGVGDDAKGWDLELVEAQAGEWEAFQAAKADCDTRISIRLLGQNLTTEVQGGAYAAAQVHNLVRFDYKRADAKSFSTALREQCLKPWAAFNYGSPDVAPMARWQIQPPDDVKAAADTLAQVTAAIANLAASPDADTRAILEKFDVPVRDEADVPAPLPVGNTDPFDPFAATSRAPVALAQVRAPPASRRAAAYVDDVASIARDRAAKAMAPNVERVLAAIAAAGSYDEIRPLLAEAFADLDPTALAEVTEHALVLSQLRGRYAIAQDHDHDNES